MVPLVGFLPASDHRVRGTVSAIEQRLLDDTFVRRYESDKTADGVPPGDGAFLACSFWWSITSSRSSATTSARIVRASVSTAQRRWAIG